MLGTVVLFACAQDGMSEEAAKPAVPATPTCSPQGQVWWNELLTRDVDRLANFYADVVGWTIASRDPGNTKLPARNSEDRYVMFTDGSQEVAGLINSGNRDAVPGGLGWFVYIQVPDVDAAVSRVQEKGGSVLRPAVTTGEGDRLAIVGDPVGNVFGLVTPATPGC
jgi:predicted enzyme related to lactoylglutathione lyase